MIDPPQLAESVARPTAVIPIVVPRGEIGQVMAAAIGELMAAVRAQGLVPAGPLYSRHTRIDPEVFDFEIGIPLRGQITGTGRVRPGQLPAARVARTTYTGPYEGLGAAWEAFDDWIVAQGETPGPELWEVYIVGPESRPDPATWRTELWRPITPAAPGWPAGRPRNETTEVPGEERLETAELVALIQRAFVPRPDDTGIAVLVDLPDAVRGDHAAWRARREMARDWAAMLHGAEATLGLPTALVVYRNARGNNGELPPTAWIHPGGPLPATADACDAKAALPFAEIYARHSILLAPTELSATAPLKLAARQHGFRAATMPGFSPAMIPALRLDYGEVNRRVTQLAALLDRASGCALTFRHPGGEAALHLDLRWRTAHASGGLLATPGVAGNLPSGEAYIVPYEGERPGEPSRSEGLLPVQFGAEVVVYRIVENRAVEVLAGGAAAAEEAARLVAEPAYGNLAELGLGVLRGFGVQPIGVLLLDEKLGLHLAFGRSDHFGGQVGPAHFSQPDAVVHLDRVYVREVQPLVAVPAVDLLFPDGDRLALLRDGDYAAGIFA